MSRLWFVMFARVINNYVDFLLLSAENGMDACGKEKRTPGDLTRY